MSSTLITRIRIELQVFHGAPTLWKVLYKPSTIAFDPVIELKFPTYEWGRMPDDFMAHLANMIAAADCETSSGERSRESVFTEALGIIGSLTNASAQSLGNAQKLFMA